MSLTAYLSGKYLGKGDFPEPTRVVIREWQEEMVGAQNGPKTKKAIMYFQGYDKGMVLNKTNIKRLIQIFGTDDDTQFIGKAIVVKSDPTIEYQGELVGGLRFMPVPRKSASEPAVPERRPGEDDDEGII
jgi:hypothetical protein